jgi:microcystin degradation protein MlrC
MELPKDSIGHIDDMTPEQLAGKTVDGLTGFVFDSKEDYLNNVSQVTGYKPTDAEHYGSRYIRVQKEVAKKGDFLTPELEAELDAKDAAVKSNNVDKNLTVQYRSREKQLKEKAIKDKEDKLK